MKLPCITQSGAANQNQPSAVVVNAHWVTIAAIAGLGNSTVMPIGSKVLFAVYLASSALLTDRVVLVRIDSIPYENPMIIGSLKFFLFQISACCVITAFFYRPES